MSAPAVPTRAPAANRRFTPEQRAAIEDRSGSRLLAANAGSGKTAVMVERFVESVVADGVPVGAILALTFTDKAAGELRDRVRRRFAELEEHDLARQAEGAWVGTIHGFCARVLRAHPFAAGLDPAFAVLDAPAAGRIARAAWERAVDDWAQAEGPAAVDLLAAYGPGLADAVLGVHGELRSRGRLRPRLPVPGPPPAPDGEALRRALEEVTALLTGAAGGARVDAARRALEACAGLLGAVSAGTPTPGMLDSARLANGASILSEAPCEAYREAWTAYRAACADHHAHAAVVLLDRLLARFGEAYEQAKRARAALDFEDLQLRVRELLAADAALRTRWSERFAVVMVDEFQDTNRLQLDVLEMLERDNLFVVGDELQSIYGFRHADVTIFRERRDALGEEGTRRLRANFRSHPELLDVLNGAFAPVFAGTFQPLVAGRPPDPPVAAGASLRLFDPDRVDEPADRPRVELLVADVKGWEEMPDEALGLALPDVPAWRRAEARVLAARLREIVDHGRRPGDVVVLVRAAASLRLLEQALEEEGLPTYVVGGRGYWSQEQVRDGLAYLAALANPLDEAALHTVLASPFCGAGADALVLAAAAGRERGGVWSALRAGVGGLPPGDAERVARFTAFFAREREVMERLPVEVLLERAIAATGYDVAVLSRRGGERRMANLRKLMRLARDYERTEGRDLRAFVAFASEQDLSEAREGEAALEGEGLDAVRLMTIHRAKGLEFPVVCVADLGRQGPSARPRILVGREGRLGLRLAALGTPGTVPALDYEALWSEREAAEAAEERRLLYVAMTRAEDQLILSGGYDVERVPDPRPGGPPMDWIVPAFVDGALSVLLAEASRGDSLLLERTWEDRRARVSLRVTRSGTLPRSRRSTVTTTAPDAGRPAPAEPVRAPVRRPPVGEVAAPALARLSYTSLGSYARCGYRFYLQRVLGLPDVPSPALPGAPASAGLDPRLRGTLVHEVLESIDLRAPRPPSADAWRTLAAAHGATLSDEEVLDLTGLVEAFADSPLRERLVRARSVRREAPFVLPLDDRPSAPILHGVVDAIAREGDGTALVVDHKTDRLDGAEPTALADGAYGTQRAAYALAALAEGADRVEVAHLFLERPDAPALVSYTAAEAPELRDRLLGLARGALAGRFPVAEHPHRELCATCPGRRRLCSHPESVTLRAPEEAQASAGSRGGSGGPS